MDDLEREGRRFARYLVGVEPDARVLAGWRRAHEQGVVTPPGGVDAFDRILVAAGRSAHLVARAADVHARFFRPGGLLRRKLVLMLALLETDREGRARADRADAGGAAWFVLRAAWAGAVSVALLALGLVPFFLARGACAFAGQPAPREESAP